MKYNYTLQIFSFMSTVNIGVFGFTYVCVKASILDATNVKSGHESL